MRVERIPREELERQAHQRYVELFPGGRKQPRYVNERAEHGAGSVRPPLWVQDEETTLLPFHGRRYEVRPISFRDGLRLVEVRQEFQDLSETEDLGKPGPEAIARYERACERVAEIAVRHVVPEGGWIRRLFWKMGLRRNPFLRASDKEVGELLGFFLACRMRSSVRRREAAPESPAR